MIETAIINPTYIDYVMLGIIQQEARSGYGILKSLKELRPGSFSSSPGTIYPALKRLKKFGLVRDNSSPNSKKKLFSLSSRGQVFLIAWLLDPISMEDVKKRKEELLLRFAFMDELVSQTEKKHFLNSFQLRIKSFIQQMEKELSKEDPEKNSHQRLMIEHQIASYKATLKWTKHALREVL
ncbi:MAG: PadR family transcriptional regulator [Bacteroidota bacterium]